MDATFAKKLYERMPEWSKRLLGSPIHAKLVGDPRFKRQYLALAEADGLSQDELASAQLAELRALCSTCYERIPFYRERFDGAGVDPARVTLDSFATLPTLDKEQVLANYNEIVVRDGGSNSYEAATGGSSGRRLVVVNSEECLYRENAFAMHFYSRYGYDYRRSRLAYFGGDGDALVTRSPLYNMIRVNTKLLNEDNFAEVLSALDDFAPDYLRGLTSSVTFFAQLCLRAGTAPAKRAGAVFLQSENVHPHQLRQLRDTFGCPVAMSYGSTERVVFGEQLGWSGDEPVYGFHPLYGLTEIAEDGCIVGTGFINSAMPLLRYVSDDVASPAGDGYTVTGHRQAPIIGRNGEHVSTASLCDLDESVDCLLAFQFVQEEPGRLVMNYLSSEPLGDGQIMAIRKCVSEKLLGSFDIEVTRVEALERTARGKMALLVQRLEVEE